MMKNQSEISVFICFTTLLFFGSCRGDDPFGCDKESTIYFYIQTNVPYQQNQEIKFADSLGHQLQFTCTLVKQSFVLGHHSLTADCAYVPDYSEVKNYFFTEKNNSADLSIQNMFDRFSTPSGDQMTIRLKGKNFIRPYPSNQYLPSITFNGVEFKDLQVFIDGDSKMYYRNDIGIVGFKTDSVLWFIGN